MTKWALKTPDWVGAWLNGLRRVKVVRNSHYCRFGVLQGRLYVIARAPRQKSINGYKVIIEPTKPYGVAISALFTVISLKQGTFEGF